MDTGSDFITAEFLHLIFFKQKSVLIYPHVDIKHLNALEIFAVGHDIIPIDKTALNSVEDILESNIYSTVPNLYIIYNLSTEDVENLTRYNNLHCILNSSEDMKKIRDVIGDSIVIYNKKTKKFLNYDFIKEDITFENNLISACKTPDLLRDEILKIKILAGKMFALLSEGKPMKMMMDLIAREYKEEQEQKKILEFMQNYYEVTLPDVNSLIKSNDLIEKGGEPQYWDPPSFTYQDEYNKIKELSGHLPRDFISCMRDYCEKKVNCSNLDLQELINPERMYFYLRKHHWNKGIPDEFLKEWLTSKQMDEAQKEILLNSLGISREKIDLFTAQIPSDSGVEISKRKVVKTGKKQAKLDLIQDEIKKVSEGEEVSLLEEPINFEVEPDYLEQPLIDEKVDFIEEKTVEKLQSSANLPLSEKSSNITEASFDLSAISSHLYSLISTIEVKLEALNNYLIYQQQKELDVFENMYQHGEDCIKQGKEEIGFRNKYLAIGLLSKFLCVKHVGKRNAIKKIDEDDLATLIKILEQSLHEPIAYHKNIEYIANLYNEILNGNESFKLDSEKFRKIDHFMTELHSRLLNYT